MVPEKCPVCVSYLYSAQHFKYYTLFLLEKLNRNDIFLYICNLTQHCTLIQQLIRPKIKLIKQLIKMSSLSD